MMKKYFQFKFDRNGFVYLLLFVTYLFLTPRFGHEWDRRCWLEWTKNVFTNGLSGVYRDYELQTDYLPLYHYFLFAFAKFQGSIEFIEKNIHCLKMITLAFDFLAALFVTRLLGEKYKDESNILFYSLLLFLNIAYFYNTLIWGQVDGIMTAFVFLSVYYALKEKVLLTIIFFVLAMNFKLQSIIFLPLIGLVLLPILIRDFSLKKLVAWIFIPAIIQVMILLPFILAGHFDKIWNIVINSAGKYPEVSMNAYNIWCWLIRDDLKTTSDTVIFFGITYKNWGLLLFFTTSFIALLPLLIDVYIIVVQKSKEKISTGKILLTAALLPLLFFFLNTEMHERYSHPTIIFIAAYSLLTKQFLPYIFISFACLLNMEGVLHYFKLKNHGTLIFDPRFVAVLFFITIVLLFYDLFKLYSKTKSAKLPDAILNH